MIAVRCANVSLGFPGRPVLTGLDLTLQQGEFVGLLGANGAGKSTLLRGLLGLHRPSQGRIDILGVPARPGQEGVGYLPQSTADALAPVTGRALLAASLNGAAWGWPRAAQAVRAAVDEALAVVDAAALAERRVARLSGGERQRVLIAQALLGAPRLLLLDEPLASLDPLNQQALVTLLRGLQRRLGLTVLCSAHDVNVLLPAVDRVLYIGGGRAALGTVDDVVTAPVLSRLYGGKVDVIRAGGRVFVVPGGTPA